MNRYITTALFATLSLTVSAQALHSSYFSESYVYRHRMNPAFSNFDDYFAMPILGNTNVDASINVGLDNFFVQGPEGKLVSFMHPSVPTSKFLNGLSSDGDNNLSQQADLTLISWGGHTMGGFTTFELGLHETAGLSIPNDLLSFLKELQPERPYNFSDARLQVSSWVDLSIGHSHEVASGLRLGFKAKALVGVGYADMHFTDFHAQVSDQEWRLRMRGEAIVAAGGRFKTDSDGHVSGYDGGSLAVNGLGAALDLGFVYDFHEHAPGLRISAAITDLGFLKWLNSSRAHNDGQEFVYHVNADSYTGDLSDQWEEISDELNNIVHMRVSEDADFQQTLSPVLNAGIEYQPSRYVSFGLLYSHRFTDLFAYDEARANLTFKLTDHFHLACSGAFTTYGFTGGASLNIHAPGFNLFFGSDRLYLGGFNSDNIPLKQGAANFQFGLTFPFGIHHFE